MIMPFTQICHAVLDGREPFFLGLFLTSYTANYDLLELSLLPDDDSVWLFYAKQYIFSEWYKIS
jgi:hypothetical protein